MKNLSGNVNYLSAKKATAVMEETCELNKEDVEKFVSDFEKLLNDSEKLYATKTYKELYDIKIRLYTLKKEVSLLKNMIN